MTEPAIEAETGPPPLLALQEIDTHIDQLRHRLGSLPEQARLDAIDARLAEIARGHADATARREDVRREQRRHEDEVAIVEAKIAQVSHQLYDSGITSPKEAEALGADLASIQRRQRDLEDLVIEQMELAEPIDAELDGLSSARAEAEAERAVAQAALDEVAGSVTAELADYVARRDPAAEQLAPGVLGTYEGLRKRLGGIGAARLSGNRCEGCHLAIPSAELEEVRRTPADALAYCPECSRILVR